MIVYYLTKTVVITQNRSHCGVLGRACKSTDGVIQCTPEDACFQFHFIKYKMPNYREDTSHVLIEEVSIDFWGISFIQPCILKKAIHCRGVGNYQKTQFPLVLVVYFCAEV